MFCVKLSRLGYIVNVYLEYLNFHSTHLDIKCRHRITQLRIELWESVFLRCSKIGINPNVPHRRKGRRGRKRKGEKFKIGIFFSTVTGSACA